MTAPLVDGARRPRAACAGRRGATRRAPLWLADQPLCTDHRHHALMRGTNRLERLPQRKRPGSWRLVRLEGTLGPAAPSAPDGRCLSLAIGCHLHYEVGSFTLDARSPCRDLRMVSVPRLNGWNFIHNSNSHTTTRRDSVRSDSRRAIIGVMLLFLTGIRS